MSVTAQQIVELSYKDLGILGDGQSLGGLDASDGLTRLNNLVNTLAIQTKTQPFIGRHVFSVTANVGTYTLGPGGTFNDIKPTGLTGAGLLLNSSTPPVEIPRALLTDDMYEAIQIKDLTSNQWTNVYFNDTYATGTGVAGLATIILWPIPTTSQNDCVLYYRDVIQGFADYSTTSYNLPYGYAELLQYNLGVRLARAKGVNRQMIPDLIALANEAMAIVKRSNYTLQDLQVDPASLAYGDRRAGYNINTGTGGN